MHLNIYNKLVGFLIKKGKKTKAKKILNKVFLFLSKKTKKSSLFILFKFFFNLNIYVEAKILKIRKSKFVVPFVIGFKRRIFLVLKWLIKCVLENKKKEPIHMKIIEEILGVLYKKKTSKLLKFKESNNLSCIKNRSNLHYRW